MLREMEEKERAKARFVQREAKMRATVRGSNADAKVEDNSVEAWAKRRVQTRRNLLVKTIWVGGEEEKGAEIAANVVSY